MRIATVILLVVLPASMVEASPLFESAEPLSVVFEFPTQELLRTAKKRPTVDGRIRYQDHDGTEVVFEASFTTRGKSRLDTCKYPPLRLNLKRKQVASTVFEGQRKLKLVTQCYKSGNSLRYLEQEYLIYQAYAKLTPYSFRVRMLSITFRDSTGRRDDETHPGFLIEAEKNVAKRLDMTPIKAASVGVSQLDETQLSILTLFQFMIGNTDWSVRSGPDGRHCCHNGKLIGKPSSDSEWVVLPYDFDQSGLINASYAIPAESLGIRSVKQRLYRGYCSTNDELEQTIRLFNDNRADIEGLFVSDSSDPKKHKRALRYVRDFYEIINDMDKRQKSIVADCR